MISPPFRCEAQQNLDDVAEPDIGSGPYPLARRRRKRDFGQEREWHGKDRGIGLEGGAAAAPCGKPSAGLLDGRHGSAEMDRGAVPATIGNEMLDERAVALGDPPLLTLSPGQPFIADCEGAGAAWIGRVVTLDRPCD